MIHLWRAAAAHGTQVEGVELAAPFQRHFTARGTGVPANFALVLTAAEVHAYKFDPARTEHPIRVGHDQFSELAASWPRASVRATEVKPGRTAWASPSRSTATGRSRPAPRAWDATSPPGS